MLVCPVRSSRKIVGRIRDVVVVHLRTFDSRLDIFILRARSLCECHRPFRLSRAITAPAATTKRKLSLANACKFLSMPLGAYSTFQFDEVIKNGRRAGISQTVGFSANAKSMLSLSLVNVEYSEPGTEVTVRWGEPNSRQPTVEKTDLHEIRAKVAPAPFYQKIIKSN